MQARAARCGTNDNILAASAAAHKGRTARGLCGRDTRCVRALQVLGAPASPNSCNRPAAFVLVSALVCHRVRPKSGTLKK